MYPTITVTDEEHTAKGVSCRFYPLNGVPNTTKMGLKVFRQATTRNEAHANQLYAWRYGLAPPVGPKVHVRGLDNWQGYHWLYGMFTGIAELPARTSGYYCGNEIANWWCDKLGWTRPDNSSFSREKIWSQIEERIDRRMQRYNIGKDQETWPSDLHTGNIGLWMGRIVLIDFSC